MLKASTSSILFYHPGIKHTLTAIQSSLGLVYIDVTHYTHSCLEYQRIHPSIESLQDSLHAHRVDGPFQTVYMELYSFTVSSVSYTVLYIINFYSKWVESILVNDKSSDTIASTFICFWVCHFGCPNKVVNDNDLVFISTILDKLFVLIGVSYIQYFSYSYHTPYHPDAPIKSFYHVLSKGLHQFFLTLRSLSIVKVL